MVGANDYFACIALRSTGVELVPISKEHISELSVIGGDPQIWRWMPTAHYAPETMTAFVESALILRDNRRAVPFVSTGSAGGSQGRRGFTLSNPSSGALRSE
jgi:N-acetyltransferase